MLPRTILVVEDDGPTREALAELLEDEAYRVITAKDGEEGQRRLVAGGVDLVICDVWMPKITGLELLAWLRRTPALSHTPIILWTARGSPGDLPPRHDGEPTDGANSFLFKPVEPDQLLALISGHLQPEPVREA